MKYLGMPALKALIDLLNDKFSLLESKFSSSKGFVSFGTTVVKGKVSFDTNNIGTHVMMTLSGYKNQKVFVYPLASLVGKQIVRNDTLSYSVQVRDSETGEKVTKIIICPAEFTIKAEKDEENSTLTITTTVSFYNEDYNVNHQGEAIELWAATFAEDWKWDPFNFSNGVVSST